MFPYKETSAKRIRARRNFLALILVPYTGLCQIQGWEMILGLWENTHECSWLQRRINKIRANCFFRSVSCLSICALIGKRLLINNNLSIRINTGQDQREPFEPHPVCHFCAFNILIKKIFTSYVVRTCSLIVEKQWAIDFYAFDFNSEQPLSLSLYSSRISA